MWIGYTLNRQRGWQSVLNSARCGGRVGPEYDRMRAGNWAWRRLKIITIADKQNFISK